MGAKIMNKLSGNHPSIEELAEYAEGRSPSPAAIEAHLDGCQSCARDVLAGREAIALEALGTDEFRMTSSFEARARRELLVVVGGKKGPPLKPASDLGALGAIGLLGTLGGLGSFTAGSDLVLAQGDHPNEIAPESEKSSSEGEISGDDTPSHGSEDEITRMLDLIHDVLGDTAADHPVDSTGQTSLADDLSAGTDSTMVPDADMPPVDHGESLDHGSSDAADDHDQNHDNTLDHDDGDNDFDG